ncbi:hypothetical protein LCGC14_2132430 [marine sediment metagenome]|uniref:Uncharacterized protein n=1 Tax=marine sediment metagenome TaxID=412755 RepID=A0A0F9E108_9ZZZZ
MSESEIKIVKNYINQVKQKLPEWLKWKEEELKDILDDLEAQLYSEARVISGEEELTDADIKEAIGRMGTPESIAKLYKKRGTPKFYLTQELFGFYLRTLFFFFAVIIFINIITAVFKFFFMVWWEVLGGMISGIWIGCLVATIVITIVFVYFSMEGFLPEDFGIIPQRLAIIFPFTFNGDYMVETRTYTKQHIEKARMLGKEKLVSAKARVEGRLAESRALREERRAEAKLYRKQKLEEAKQKRLFKKTQPVTISELIFGIFAGLIFGLFLIIHPFSGTGIMLPAFLDWLKLFGFLILVGALFDLIRLVIGVNNYTGQQVFLIIGALYSISYIPVFLLLLNQPEIFPISLFSGGNIPIIPYDPSNITYIVYFWVIIVIIIGIIGGMIGNVVKVGKYSKLKKAY